MKLRPYGKIEMLSLLLLLFLLLFLLLSLLKGRPTAINYAYLAEVTEVSAMTQKAGAFFVI